MSSYKVKVLADSMSPDGVRLTTLEVTFPRFILAEVNTHRMLSRNSASSRAIPVEKQIERCLENPFIPETFNKRVKGMGVGAALDESDQEEARIAWLEARDHAVNAARALVALDVDKSRANRLLEPFMWHTAIISATEWDNFFALRCHPAAQPEFRIVAELMREALFYNVPQRVGKDSWHLPMVSVEEVQTWITKEGLEGKCKVGDRAAWDTVYGFWKLVSAGRCARVSYDTQDNFEEPEASVERARRLMGNGHFSPFEHVARPIASHDYATREHVSNLVRSNFRGWVQFRKEIPHEDNFGLVAA